ncbi:MAG TPA: hypothetical protein VFM55_22210 [Micromonosporaceae bacterium]|nr:hypothetical protein [Micromonosporaceae bacterium]
MAAGVLALLLAGAGCGQDAGDGAAGPAVTTAGVASPTPGVPSPSVTASRPSSPGVPAPTARFEVANRKVVSGPRRVEVKLGSQVVIEVLVDAADEIHVHGYDNEAAVAPGKPTRLVLTANIPGVFEVELHSGIKLCELRVS